MNVGLVGCGRVSEIHMNAYKNIREAKAIAVSDINLDRAEAFSRVILDQSTSHNQKNNFRMCYSDQGAILCRM